MRQQGLTQKASAMIKDALNEGSEVMIASLSEGDYIHKLAHFLKQDYGIEITIERLTRKRDRDMELKFDSWGEPIGIQFNENVQIFCGWTIKKK